MKESLPEGHPIHHTMLDCLKAFNQISQHFDAIAGFPTPSELALAENLAKRFFDQHDDLHAWALSKYITQVSYSKPPHQKCTASQLQNASQL